MNPITASLAARLDALKRARVIAGWQNGGATRNVGLSRRPLPVLIFPADSGPAATFYSERAVAEAAAALETFGPMTLRGASHA